MPNSRPDLPEAAADGRNLAVAAEVLYLANLLVAPGAAFLGLAWLFFRHRRSAPELARCHLVQTFAASLWAGVLLVACNLLILAMGGYQSATTWIVLILYFTCCHSALILLGMVGLARAMAGRHWHFPLVGRPCPGAQH